jgi:hypothetical protein
VHPSRHYDVFISYSRHDEGLVKPLAALIGVADSLTRYEAAVFLDVQELKPGDLWRHEIVSAIRGAKVFVLCWCCKSRQSEFISEEIAVALEDPRKRIVPVLFCEKPLPEHLENRQWIDLRGRVQHDCQSRHKPAVPPSFPLTKNEELSLWWPKYNKLGPPDHADVLACEVVKYFLDLTG